ncbi:MAG: SPOR domain-containing protein, partial [Roseovarius sp.]
NPGSSAGPIYYTAGQVRVAPRHVYESQLASTDGVSVPEGYAPVWEDDRLNTRRAHQTFAGKAQMEKVWTKSVPQRMYRKPAGPTVTAETVPASSYSYYSTPSYSFAQNSAAGGQRDAVVPAPRQSAVVSHPSQQNGAVVAEAGDSRVKTTVSTRSAPAAEAPSHRYVQIGAFSDAGHAQRTAQKLASSGVRASMGKVSRDGKSYTLLLAGPFATQAELDSGLKRVRGMGYSEATLRR